MQHERSTLSRTTAGGSRTKVSESYSMDPLKAQVLPILSIVTGRRAYACMRFDGYSIRHVSNHPNRRREHQRGSTQR